LAAIVRGTGVPAILAGRILGMVVEAGAILFDRTKPENVPDGFAILTNVRRSGFELCFPTSQNRDVGHPALGAPINLQKADYLSRLHFCSDFVVCCKCSGLVYTMRTFTLEEAQSLLPVLESLLKRAIEGRRSAQTAESSLSEVAQRIYLSGGMRVNTAEVARQRAEMDSQLQRVRESIAEIDAIGVQVKDLEAGLLDFPCRVDDEVVLLCWRMGEPAIEHWHTMEAGFQGRQPVDERFRRRAASGDRPN